MSYGQTLLKSYLSLTNKKFLEDTRPAWLGGLELDFLFVDENIAFEFNGDQHYYPTSFGQPHSQKERDARKRKVCEFHGINLIIVEACELVYHRLRSKCRTLILKQSELTIEQQASLKELDKSSSRYRKILVNTFSSATARNKKRPVLKSPAQLNHEIQVESAKIEKLNHRLSILHPNDSKIITKTQHDLCVSTCNIVKLQAYLHRVQRAPSKNPRQLAIETLNTKFG